MADNDKTIFVERETYSKNDKEYYTYFIKGNVRGKDVKIGIVPPDVGGYVVLDIVYDGAMQAALALKPYEIRDDKTKKVTKGVTYAVTSKDASTAKRTSVRSSRRGNRIKRCWTCCSHNAVNNNK